MSIQVLFVLSLVVIRSLSVLLPTHYIIEGISLTDAGLYLATSASGTLLLDEIAIPEYAADCYFKHSRLSIESEPSRWTLWIHIRHLTEESLKSLKSLQPGIEGGARLFSSEWFSLTLYLKLENLQGIL